MPYSLIGNKILEKESFYCSDYAKGIEVGGKVNRVAGDALGIKQLNII